MRILGVGDTLDLASLYLDLQQRRHEVRVFGGDQRAHRTMTGMLTIVEDWRVHLDWIRQAGDDGFIVFETTSHGAVQDDLRRDGFHVIGGSAYGDRLENDRTFGQDTMRDTGMRVASSHSFQSFADAIAWVRQRPQRYVYKPSGAGFASGRTFLGELDDASDMLAYLALQARHWPSAEPVHLILMERLSGVEVGVGAYFDGHTFLQPACLDWEHKRFFPGDLGELTGEMGTLVTFRNSEKLFAETLGRMETRLRAAGHCGYVNINCIVDVAGVHPLEFTCRFGYPGYAILQVLQRCGWEDLFRRMAKPHHEGKAGGTDIRFATDDGFAVGVVLTVPPFPYSTGYERLSRGLPITFTTEFDDADRRHVHLAEVERDGDQLVTSGAVGYIMVVTGQAATPSAARDDAYARLQRVSVPNGRYRRDIGAKFIAQDEQSLRSFGWL